MKSIYGPCRQYGRCLGVHVHLHLRCQPAVMPACLSALRFVQVTPLPLALGGSSSRCQLSTVLALVRVSETRKALVFAAGVNIG